MKTKQRITSNNGNGRGDRSPGRVINEPPQPGPRMLRAIDAVGVTVNELQAQVMNVMLRRQDMFENSLDAKHKIDRDCGYPSDITTEQYATMYKREGIAKRVVSLEPEESWKDDPEILETDDTEVETQFELELKRIEKKFKIFSKLQRLDRLSGIGQFGVLLIGINDGKELVEPVEGVKAEDDETPASKVENIAFGAQRPPVKTKPGQRPPLKPGAPKPTVPGGPAGKAPAPPEPYVSKRRLLYLRPLAQEFVDIDAFETDPKNPRFGLPNIYNIKFQQADASTAGRGESMGPKLKNQKVHWSRIIHVADNLESDEVFGTPRMQDVFNPLFDLRKIRGGSGEMFWKGGFPGINFKADPVSMGARPMTKTEREELKEEVQAYMSGLQRYIATEGITAEPLAPAVADPTNHTEMNLKIIAISKGCPYRVFTGTEEAKLAGSQDTRAWNGRVNRRREKHVSPNIVEPFVDRLMQMTILPTVEYHTKWQDLNTMSDTEKAANGAVRATAISGYVSASADTLVPPEQFLSIILGLEDTQVRSIMDASEQWVRNMETKIQDDQVNAEKDREMQAKVTEASIKQGAAKAKGFGKPAFGGKGKPKVKSGASKRPRF